ETGDVHEEPIGAGPKRTRLPLVPKPYLGELRSERGSRLRAGIARLTVGEQVPRIRRILQPDLNVPLVEPRAVRTPPVDRIPCDLYRALEALSWLGAGDAHDHVRVGLAWRHRASRRWAGTDGHVRKEHQEHNVLASKGSHGGLQQDTVIAVAGPDSGRYPQY